MKLIFGIFCEIFWFVWYGSLTILSLLFHPTIAPGSEKNKIVFVHSWMGQPLAYIFLKRFLEKRGISVLFTNMGLETGDITKSAEKLQKYIEQRNLKDIILVGGSIGAIISVVYLEELGGWKNVRKFIAISAPFSGSFLSHFAFLSKSARQIKPQSLFLKNLREKVSHKERIISLYGRFDEFVAPKSSIMPGVKNIQVDEIGHAKIQMFSRKVWKIIVSELE